MDNLNVLVVDEIGKTYSGTGMDTNVIGRRGISTYEDLARPHIKTIAALSLVPESQGNAIGVGWPTLSRAVCATQSMNTRH